MNIEIVKTTDFQNIIFSLRSEKTHINYFQPIQSRQEGAMAMEFTGSFATRSIVTMNYEQIDNTLLSGFGKPFHQRNYVIFTDRGQDRCFIGLIPNHRLSITFNETLDLIEVIDKFCDFLNQNQEILLEEIVKLTIEENELTKPKSGSSMWHLLKESNLLQFFDK